MIGITLLVWAVSLSYLPTNPADFTITLLAIPMSGSVDLVKETRVVESTLLSLLANVWLSIMDMHRMMFLSINA